MLVRGCEFRQPRPHIDLGESVRRGVITGNLFAGEMSLRNRAKGTVEMAANVDDASP